MTLASIRSEQVQRLLTTRGPFASVYFDDSHDAPDAALRLDSTWQGIKREVELLGATTPLVAALEHAVLDTRPPVGRSTHGIIAAADGVVVDEHLLHAAPMPVVRVSDLPYLVPMVHFGASPETYVVVAIDHVGAELSLHQRRSVHTETVEAGGYPVHKAASADIRGWNDPQHRVDEAIRKNVRAVADRLVEDCDRHRPELVFIIGQDRVRAELVAALPERVTSRVVRPRVGTRGSGVDDTVQRAITMEFQNRRAMAEAEIARRYRAHAGRRSGLCVTGLSEVCAALREDAVDTLIIGDMSDRIVLAGDELTLVAPDPEALSAFGAAPTHTLRADEAIPFAALANGAALVSAEEGLDVSDGVAALLRYPTTTLR